MKRLFACLLSLILLCAFCAAGTAETQRVGTTLFPCDENGYPDLGGVTITIWMPFDSTTAEYATSYGELKIIQNLEAMLNVNLEFMHPPVGSETEGFSTMLASGDYPDIIWNDYVKDHYQGGVAMAYDDGLIWDYTELVSPETTPNYWEKVMEQPYMARQAIDDDGRNVGLGAQVSGSENCRTCMWGLMIRKDLLDEAGLDVPVTMDDWTAMLRKFKEMGVKYPLLLKKSGYWRSRNAFSGAWNVDTRNFNLTADGGVEYGPATEGYKEMLKYLHLWSSEGLINPDFTTDTQQDTWSMLANDEGGAVVDHTYRYTSNYHVVVDVDNHPEEALVAAQMPRVNADDPLPRVMITNRELCFQKYICDSSEVKTECVAFLDALYIDEIEFMMSNGIEGIGYNLNEMGYPVITDIEFDENATVDEKLSCRLYEFETESDSDLNYIITSKYCYGVQPQTVELLNQCEYDLMWPYGASFTVEEAEVIAEVQTDIETYRDEMLYKFISGAADIDADFDAYVEQLNKLGLDRLQKVYEASYARYLAR